MTWLASLFLNATGTSVPRRRHHECHTEFCTGRCCFRHGALRPPLGERSAAQCTTQAELLAGCAPRRHFSPICVVPAQDHRQPGAAEIQNIRDFTPLLRAHPWLLWFEDQQDEDGYTAHMWEKLWQRQVVSTSLHFVFIVLVAALALAPLDVYDDTNTLLMFLLGQLVPTAVMIAWAVTPWWRLQARCVPFRAPPDRVLAMVCCNGSALHARAGTGRSLRLCVSPSWLQLSTRVCTTVQSQKRHQLTWWTSLAARHLRRSRCRGCRSRW